MAAGKGWSLKSAEMAGISRESAERAPYSRRSFCTLHGRGALRANSDKSVVVPGRHSRTMEAITSTILL
jgi:hypothetical protein